MSPTNQPHRQRHWICALQIAERRRSLGLTQQDVVDRLAEFNVSATNRTLSAMEHGQGIDVGRLPEMAMALNCTVTFLLGLTEDPLSWVPDAVAQEGSTGGRHSPVAVPQVTANSRPNLMRFAGIEPVAARPARPRATSRA
ncbi:MAG: helix-turn-helix domain-containing protein [Sporichthyaceae bacterium]